MGLDVGGELDGRPDGGVAYGGWIGAPALALHVGELVAQARDSAQGEFPRQTRQERMAHAGARTMSDDENRTRARRSMEKRGNAKIASDLQSDWLRLHL